MIAARRTSWNFALDRALAWSRELKQPLVVLEALDCDYPWASDRLHRFVLDGMRGNRSAFAGSGVTYHPYVEPTPGAGRGLLPTLVASASVVVTDDAPVFFLPALTQAAARYVTTRFEAVDSNGILPVNAPPKGQVFPSAYAFRRYLQRELPLHLEHRPASDPLGRRALPRLSSLTPDILARWPAADAILDPGGNLDALPIDHSVAPVARAGGESAARQHLDDFVADRLEKYADRNDPDEDVSSRLSAYLHFGHISAHEIVHRVLAEAGWSPQHVSTSARGLREGWWGASRPVEAFLDQLITWRELGFNMSARRTDYRTFEALPSWALATLDRHAGDRREHVYTPDQFAAAATHDALWNAAQRQLLEEGRIHNYLRMLWGKKVLEWSASPRDAFDVMVALNDRHAVDGRDPNSYSGIAWVFGRYDRPWAPERPIFGTVRYMTSASAMRKLRVKQYMRRYGPGPAVRRQPASVGGQRAALRGRRP
jgi:deoxyribodipyrimidine photo-lyase